VKVALRETFSGPCGVLGEVRRMRMDTMSGARGEGDG
jgi:hypothetical protein